MFSFQVDDELKIELIQQQHKEELFRLIDTNREHLRKWLLWVDKRQTAEDFDTIIPQWISKFANNDGFDAGIRYNERLVGMIGLHHIDWKNKATSIGYFLSEEAQGNGIITKCVRALITYLFNELDLHRIEIQCAETNHRSRTIPIKLGFFEEGVTRDGQWLYDHYENLITYSLLKSKDCTK
ncbi:GNAT family N-acetyltransferase [Peribacillus psychrosaccharolyticus]|uniref:GNAT family N-acetyltransferase n=2 Tax=Peribacillus psychrosaccharolyticus TaxID=1407 RepID=A0A974NME3_PERPY|nr:GNAT family protein [Peribacillus psychrosaccharolyticus]MEC2056333.1 GNAT family protein [Peribacillus psychrosaccharolyticus]MED3743735.1 GNAT family protein [Peribacillus psychrosaccharolyticus]QQT00500.1 GNAT family N-acetyltransferase [Peribacillus psychrosaccharolyticus]